MACRCLAVSGRRGRSLLPTEAPAEELHREHAGRKLDRSCEPPRTAATTWSTMVAYVPHRQHARPHRANVAARRARQPGGHCHVPLMVTSVTGESRSRRQDPHDAGLARIFLRARTRGLTKK
jgi:hypothetical protein